MLRQDTEAIVEKLVLQYVDVLVFGLVTEMFEFHCSRVRTSLLPSFFHDLFGDFIGQSPCTYELASHRLHCQNRIRARPIIRAPWVAVFYVVIKEF